MAPRSPLPACLRAQRFITGFSCPRRSSFRANAWDLCRVHQKSTSAEAVRLKTFDSDELRLLEWLEGYFDRRDVHDFDLRETLNSAIEQCGWRSGPTPWSLRLAVGNRARLNVGRGRPRIARLERTKATNGLSHEVPLNLRENFTCRSALSGRFDIRADRPRRAAAGVARFGYSWAGLGWYQEFDVTKMWIYVRQHFLATSDCDVSRLHFDLGSEPSVVEVKGRQPLSRRKGERGPLESGELHRLDLNRCRIQTQVEMCSYQVGIHPRVKDRLDHVPVGGQLDLREVSQPFPIATLASYADECTAGAVGPRQETNGVTAAPCNRRKLHVQLNVVSHLVGGPFDFHSRRTTALRDGQRGESSPRYSQPPGGLIKAPLAVSQGATHIDQFQSPAADACPPRCRRPRPLRGCP